jgi:hypothetical protein
MTKRFIFLLMICLSTVLWTSCNKDFLDVSKELAEERDMEKLFSNPDDVRRWHRNIYSGIPNSAVWNGTPNGLNHPWPLVSDEYDGQFANDWNLEPFDASNTRLSRWSLWQLIRQANVFLENATEIAATGDADFLGMDELEGLKAQAQFLRAYYHYLLFELYGPIPIMNTAVNPEDENLDFARNSVDEVVQFIYNELTEAAARLKDPDLSDQTQLAVPTKGTALAVRGRLMMYAASPLLNGEYSEALNVTNKDGKRLFPAKDASKWQKALTAMQEFIDYADAGHYELHKEFTGSNYDPHKSIYEIFMKYNKEIIFARSDVSWGDVSTRAGVDGASLPRSVRGGNGTTGNIAVTQELVDDYFMIDGLKIEESNLYKESGLSVVGEDQTGNTEVGTSKMYINREPRFYQAVFFNGRKWHIGNEKVMFNKGGNTDFTSAHPRTGYLAYKRLSKKVYNLGTNPKSEYRPAILFRLAEFYLLYAEALNEVNPADTRVLQYVDRVRERAGIPKLVTIKSAIIGIQEEQRKAIRQEMRVELASEGQRYFDVRRWMIAQNTPGEGGQGGAYYGMDLFANTLEGFYNRIVMETRVWNRNMYLYPIPLSNIQKSRLLVQNPGY